MHGNFKNLIGQRFGKLTVIGLNGWGKSKHSIWLCKCDCGKENIVFRTNLTGGKTKSCGCMLKTLKDGMYQSKEHRAWSNMLQRCRNKNNPRYKRWGGRGIKVCKRWYKFNNFYEDMGEIPEGLTLDRIDNDKGYYKENCRWATWKEQANNRSNNVN